MTTRTCPYCQERPIETVATIPYVRGLVVAYTLGAKKLIGCRRCVRRRIYREVGTSSVLGWFSLTAALINPMLITYGAVRGLFVRPDAEGVRRALEQAGLPEDGMAADPLRVAYGLAAAMIAADGKVEDEEISVAIEIGRQLFEDFEADAFFRVMAGHKSLPAAPELAFLLAEILEEREKLLVYDYLGEIAASDGEVSREEEVMLAEVRRNLGLADLAAGSLTAASVG